MLAWRSTTPMHLVNRRLRRHASAWEPALGCPACRGRQRQTLGPAKFAHSCPQNVGRLSGNRFAYRSRGSRDHPDECAAALDGGLLHRVNRRRAGSRHAADTHRSDADHRSPGLRSWCPRRRGGRRCCRKWKADWRQHVIASERAGHEQPRLAHFQPRLRHMQVLCGCAFVAETGATRRQIPSQMYWGRSLGSRMRTYKPAFEWHGLQAASRSGTTLAPAPTSTKPWCVSRKRSGSTRAQAPRGRSQECGAASSLRWTIFSR